MSTTRLLVLGCVRIFQPVHGYDVRRELMSWHANEWAHVAPGSIYSSLKTLVKDGMLEVVGTAQVGARPERTTYRLTARGEEEHKRLLRTCWWEVEQLADPLMAAISLLTFTSRADIIAALEHRIGVIRLKLAHVDYLVSQVDGIEQPDHVIEMFKLSGARLGSEIAWAEGFIARLRAGEYVTADEWKRSKLHAKATRKPKRR